MDATSVQHTFYKSRCDSTKRVTGHKVTAKTCRTAGNLPHTQRALRPVPRYVELPED